MYQVPRISEQIYYVGVNDRNKALFENMWALPNGVSYNSYLLVGDVSVLVDTVDLAFADIFFYKLESVLKDRSLDYLIINHIEPDHGGAIGLLRQRYPDVQIIGNKKTFQMLEGYHGIVDNLLEVKNGAELDLGNFKFRFVFAPMVHWPEVMFSYEVNSQTLFTADAFGSFGALNGHIFDYECNMDLYFEEIYRYYACILGKYGSFVQKTIKAMDKHELAPKFVCPTHGPVWTEQYYPRVRAIYEELSAYKGKDGVVIIYGSMYGNTETLADVIAESLVSAGVKHVVCHNVSQSTKSQILSDVFQYKGLIIGSPTYCGELFSPVEEVINMIRIRGVKDRLFASFGSFSWAAASVKKLKPLAEEMKWEEVGESVEMKMSNFENVIQEAWMLGQSFAQQLQNPELESLD